MNKLLWRKRKGFTLIELIVVITVLAIIVAIAVPVFINIDKKAKEQVVLSNAVTISISINANNALYKDDKTKLIEKVPADSEALQKALGDFKVSLSSEDTETALKLVEINNYVASVESASK